MPVDHPFDIAGQQLGADRLGEDLHLDHPRQDEIAQVAAAVAMGDQVPVAQVEQEMQRADLALAGSLRCRRSGR